MSDAAGRGKFTAIFRSTILLFAVWALVRIYGFAAAYDSFPYRHGVWLATDVELFKSWAPFLAHFHFPVADDRWQYPPGAGILLTLPQWSAHLLHLSYEQTFQGLVLIADLVLTIVLIWAGKKLAAPAGGLSGAWLWTLLPLYFGPIMAARFDTFAALCAVIALVLLYVHRPAWAGAAMGIGALIKVWPALMILGVKRREWPRAILGLAVGAAVVSGIALFWSNSWSFLSNELHRGLQIESVGALPFIIMWHFGHAPSYDYIFGALEIKSQYVHTIGFAISLVGFVLLATLVVLRLVGRLERLPLVDVAFAALLVSVATSRVYSPQYNIWLIAIGAVVLIDRASRVRWAVWCIVAASICGQLVYPIYYPELMTGSAIGVGLQTARIGFLLAATFIAYYQVMRGAFTKQPSLESQDQPQPVAA